MFALLLHRHLGHNHLRVSLDGVVELQGSRTVFLYFGLGCKVLEQIVLFVEVKFDAALGEHFLSEDPRAT